MDPEGNIPPPFVAKYASSITLDIIHAWNTRLESIELNWCNMNSQQLTQVISGLGNLPGLTELGLGWNRLDPDNTERLGGFLQQATALSALNLSGTGINEALLRVLNFPEHISELQLRNNALGDTDLEPLIQLLHQGRFRSLNLGWNSFTLAGLQTLGAALTNHTLLTHLDLSSNSLGMEGCQILHSSLAYQASLKDLILTECDLKDDACYPLAKLLKTNTTLAFLDISFNKIGVEGCEVLGEALTYNFSLTQLKMRDNHLRDKGCIALCAALQQNKSIHNLDLSWNGIGIVGSAAICDLLKHNQTLKELVLLHNYFTQEELDMFTHAVNDNAQLQHLQLVKNRLVSPQIEAKMEPLERKIARNHIRHLTLLDWISNPPPNRQSDTTNPGPPLQ